MESLASRNHRLRFKAFELDLHTRELYKNGIRLRVQGQPIDVLEMLLERPGELVTREQLRKKLWPDDTFVDFEHSLNSAVMRLRDALGDRADDPNFIETLPKLGYRFVAPVEVENGRICTFPNPAHAGSTTHDHFTGLVAFPGTTRDAATFPTAESTANPFGGVRWRGWVLLALLALVSGGAFFWYASQPLSPPHISETVRITSDVRWAGKLVIGVDTSRVFLRLEGNPPVLGEVPISGGEIETIPIPVPGLARLGAVSPDGNSLLVCGKYDPKDNMSELWVAGTMGSPIRYLARAFCIGRLAAWSPDGKEVIYPTADGGIYTIPATGGEPRLVHKLDGEVGLFAYPPDGSKIRFSYRERNARGIWRIWEMSAKGENLHQILPKWNPGANFWNGRWTSDGDFFIFLLTKPGLRPTASPFSNQIWVIDERRGLLKRPSRVPVQLTAGEATWTNPIPSPDGQKIFAERYEFRGELVRYDRRLKQLELYLGGRSAEMLDFSRDGKFVIYVSFPSGVLWRASRDGNGIQQVTKAPHEYVVKPRSSPDGSQIVFTDRDVRAGSETSSMYIVTSKGGIPVQVLPDDPQDEYEPTWSPDGRKLAFGSLAYWQARSVDPSTEVRIVDLATRKVTNLPTAPRHARTPQWSPDGRYIVCLTSPGQLKTGDGLQIYDFNKSKWTVLLQGQSAEWPAWSSDGQWIYFVSYGKDGHFAFYQIRPVGGLPEFLGDLAGFHDAGFSWGWFGFDPDGNPLMLRDAGTDEIYALTLGRE